MTCLTRYGTASSAETTGDRPLTDSNNATQQNVVHWAFRRLSSSDTAPQFRLGGGLGFILNTTPPHVGAAHKGSRSMTTRQEELSHAIDLSVHENRIVHIEIQGESIEDILADIAAVHGGDMDHATENDGSHDVWGWPGGDSEMEWRLNITLTTE